MLAKGSIVVVLFVVAVVKSEQWRQQAADVDAALSCPWLVVASFFEEP